MNSAKRLTSGPAFIYLLCFLSGCAALIYETLWLRFLTITFGHTVYAVSTILTAFMAGLACGSYLAGRWGDRAENPVRLYAWLELGIGVYALFVPSLFAGLYRIYLPIYHPIADSFTALTIVRFLLSLVFLILPTTLMGATIPILIRGVTSRLSHLGRRVGTLYAVNTAGAVVGCFTTGFFLIPMLGQVRTNLTAVILNLAIGAAALALFRIPAAHAQAAGEAIAEGGIGAPAATRGEIAEGGFTPGVARSTIERQQVIVLVVVFLSGFVALAYEVVWFRALIFSLIYSSTTYTFTAMLTTFLFGIAAGSALCARWADRISSPLLTLAVFQASIGLASIGLVSLLLSGALDAAQIPAREDLFFLNTVRDFIRMFLFMLGPTLLMGATIPLAARLMVTRLEERARAVGRMYAINTLGGILGSFTAGFVLIPSLGLATASLCLGLISLGSAVWLFWIGRVVVRRLAWTVAGLVVVAGLAAAYPRGRPVQRFRNPVDVCFYEEGRSSVVAAVREQDDSHVLFIDNVRVQDSNTVLGDTDIKEDAHLSMLLHPDPKSALIIGFGTGGTAWSFLQYPQLQRLRVAEIEPAVLRAARCFPDVNHGCLPGCDPRYRVILDDARSYLQLTDDTYDIITADLTDIAYKSNSDIYTREFIELCRRRLNPGGMFMMWNQLNSLSESSLRTLLATFYDVFPQGTCWSMMNHPSSYLTFVARLDTPLTVDWTKMQERLAVPAVRSDLASIYLENPYKFLTGYLAGPATMKRYLAGADLHTVDRPILEFEAPKYANRTERIRANMDILYTLAAEGGYDLPVTRHPDFDKAFEPYLATRRLAIRGFLALLGGEPVTASMELRSALLLDPADQSLLLRLNASDRQIAVMERLLAENPGDSGTLLQLSWAYRLRGRCEEALDLMKPAIAAGTADAPLRLSHGSCLMALGRYPEAEAVLTPLRSSLPPQVMGMLEARLKIIERLKGKGLAALDGTGLRQVGELYLDAQEFHSAADCFERAQRRGTSTVDEGVALAMSWLRLGQLDRVQRLCEEARRRAPDRFEPVYLLGYAYLEAYRLPEAAQLLEEAHRMQPDHAPIVLSLARALALQGRRDEARRHLMAALAGNDPDFRALVSQDPVLAGLIQ